MKNLIFLVIDSLGNKNCEGLGFSVTPFLDELKKKSFYCPNMYSQAPYTEAAVMSMLCGRETMNDGGYFYRFRDAKTLFDYFYENKFHVVNYIQPHVYASSIRRSAQDYYYNVCHDFHVVFSYRLSFYSDKIKTTPLSDYEYKKVITLMDDNFKECRLFYQAYLHEDNCVSLLLDNLKFTYTKEQIEQAVIDLDREFMIYENDKTGYVEQLLKEEYSHALFQLPIMDQSKKINDVDKQWVMKEWSDTFRDIKIMNRSMNKKIRKFSLKQMGSLVKSFAKTRDKESLKSIARYGMYYRNSYTDPDLYERLSLSYDNFKSAPSIEKHLEHFYGWLDQHKEEPYMACVHVDDIHNPEVFFSYDVNDKDVLKEEKERVESVIRKCNSKKSGSLTYYLSLAYIDLKIERFFKALEERNELEDTCVIITGDHGFSFDDIDLRPSRVNNFYLENYQIPFICYGSDIAAYQMDKKCSSKDILPTILDLFDIRPEHAITGNTLFDKTYVEQRSVVTSEYVGGGCPEMDQREILICAHDVDWLVVGAVTMSQKKVVQIKEVYHLRNDPQQKKNLVSKNLKDEGLQKVIQVLEKRYGELYENYHNWKEKDR